MSTSAPRPIPGPRPGPHPGAGGPGGPSSAWAARLAAALPVQSGRLVLPHHTPSGESASYSYPTEDDAVVLLPGTAVVVQLLPAEEGRVVGHYAAYHWQHEHGGVRTVVPNPLARIRHKQSVLYTRLGRRTGTQGVVVHYDTVDVSGVELGPAHHLVPLSRLEAWLSAHVRQGRGPAVPVENLRPRLHRRLPQSWPDNGYRRGRVLTYQDTRIIHEGVHLGADGRENRVALVIEPNETTTTRYGAARDQEVAHRLSTGPVHASFTVENGTRLVVPLSLPPGPDLAARLRTGLTTDEALGHSLALLRTVADVHARYVVHQAIRPELAFPHEDGRKVTLIGAAYARIGSQGGGTDLLRSVVRDAHVAPEIHEGGPRTVPQAADLWSWATVTLALLLSPGAGENPRADLARLPDGLPTGWRGSLERCLGRQGERPSAHALLRTLDRTTATVTAGPRDAAPPRSAPAVARRPSVTRSPGPSAPAPVTSSPHPGARLYQLAPYQTEQERKVAHTLAKGLDPTDAVIVAARAEQQGRELDVDCVVLRGDMLIAVECKAWRIADGLDPSAAVWQPDPSVRNPYTTSSPLPKLRRLAPALKRQIGWSGRTDCLLVLPTVPTLADPGSPDAAHLVSEDPATLLGRIRRIAPGDDRPPEFAECLRRLVGEIATPPVLSGFRLQEPHALGDNWQAFRAELNGLPHYLKVIGEHMSTLPRQEAARLRRALSDRTHEVARKLAERPELADRVFRPVQLPRDTPEVEPNLLIAYVWEHDNPVRRLSAPLAAAQTAAVIKGLAAAVTDLHAGGVILRELSPDSAYRCAPPPGADPAEPYYKVSMLEWMRVPQASTASVSQLFSRFPSPYVAPEIRDGDRLRHPAGDLYSLAAVAHWLLTGEDPPYRAAADQAPAVLAAYGVPMRLITTITAALRLVPTRPSWAAREFAARLTIAATVDHTP
ncbi:hypothetical protein ACFVW5_26405 [Streptomyces sp. NPDC058232]|uniref:hypothetical protein n=1 Tax=Streptomyces sp. NPDC058232 TaxID=3346393 RepID=UPI0036EB7C6D